MGEEIDEVVRLLETYDPQPVYILSGSGNTWYYSDAKRTMVRVHRGTECIFCEEDPEDPKKYIVQIGTDIFSIPRNEIIEVGWN